MRCSLCGKEFAENEAQAACRSCAMTRSCHMTRCPNCGYEMPAEPGFLRKLKSLRKGRHETGRTG